MIYLNNNDTIKIFADYVTLTGFTIFYDYPYYIKEFIITSDYVNISGNIFILVTIYLEKNQGCTISENVFTNRDTGDASGVSFNSCSNHTIVNNKMYAETCIGFCGFYINNSNHLTISNNIVDHGTIEISNSKNITVTKNYISGFWDYASLGVTNSQNIVIEGNTILPGLMEPESLIYFNVVSDSIISGNFLRGNRQQEIYYTSESLNNHTLNDSTENTLYGLNFWEVKNTLVINNSIRDNSEGIIMYSSSLVSVNNNEISNNEQGIDLWGGCVNCTFYGNLISNNSDVGIKLLDVGLNVIERNKIQNNKHGLSIEDSHAIISSNNFINNNIHALIICRGLEKLRPPTLIKQTWENNYWDNWKTRIPRPIIGTGIILIQIYRLILPIPPFPFFQFDWHPAKKPHDIPGMS